MAILNQDGKPYDSKANVVWQPLAGTSQELAITSPASETLYCGTRGCGKGLPLDEPIYTPQGMRKIGDIKAGDFVCCPDGSISPVIGVFPQGKRPTYEFTFSDGAVSRCDDQHIWAIHVQDGNKPSYEGDLGYRLMLTPEIIRRMSETKAKLHIPTLDVVRMRNPERSGLKVDPYLLGMLLGDGSFTQGGRFCTADQELCDVVVNQHAFIRHADDKRNGLMSFRISPSVVAEIKALKLWACLSYTKFIPKEYLHHTPDTRLALLQGLMDTDGTVSKDGTSVSFCSTSEQLVRDVQYLARSLGATATLTTKTTTGMLAYTVYIQAGRKFIPFRLHRKASRYTQHMHAKLWRRIVAVREIGEQDTVCIKIAHPLGLFITRDFVVTHNTDVQIFKFGRNVGIGYGEYYRGIIFDKQYKNLDDIVSRTKRWFFKIWGNDVKWYSNKADYKWVWKTGEELLIRAMEKDEDYDDYHGQEYPFIGWNELTKYANATCYENMMSCNRTSFDPKTDAQFGAELPDLPLEIFSTTNPFGVGRGWVHKRFIVGGKYGQLQKHTQLIFDPREQKEVEYTTTRVALFGHYKENTKLPAQYIATLGNMANKNKRAAWLQGRWDVAGGGAFEDCYDEDIHIVNNFTVPSGWEVFPTFDWGSSAPFWVGWWALTNGEECYIPNDDGEFDIVTYPANTLILIDEWYGADDAGKGLKLGATAIAEGMKARVKQMYERDYLYPDCAIEIGNADGQIFNKVNNDDPTIADWFEKEGIEWYRADKSKGSRIHGLALLQERMLSSMRHNGRPEFYVMRRNVKFIETVFTLPSDPDNLEDIDTDAEDHAYDGARYAVLRAQANVVGDLSEIGTA